MKLKLVQLALVFTALFTCLAMGWFIFHSIGSGKHDDHGIQASFRTISDEENVFAALRQLKPDDIPKQSAESARTIAQSIIAGRAWDRSVVTRLVRQHESHLDLLTNGLERPHFQSGPAVWGPQADQVDYRTYQALNDLLLLQASLHNQAGRVSQASESVTLALTFADRLRHDQNGSLVAYFVGQAMLETSLQWLERVIQHGTLADSQLTGLAAALARLPAFDQDGFRKSLYGEYMTTRSMLALIADELHKEHRRKASTGDGQGGFQLISQIGNRISAFQSFLLTTGFSNYLLQPERTLQMRADQIQELAQMGELPCQAINFDAGDAERSAWDFLRPGGLFQDLLAMNGAVYRQYFERRCLSQTRLESVQALIAIERYRRAHGDLPAVLRQLVPEYLAQEPRDWFGGKTLRYDPENAWVHSTGLDYLDEAGSQAAILSPRCASKPKCINEPTFSLRPVNPATLQTLKRPDPLVAQAQESR